MLIVIATILSGLYLSWRDTCMLFAMLMITWLLPMIPAFTVYFGFWHSMHTLFLIKQDIKVTTQGLISKATPYLAICVGITFVMMALFSQFSMGSEVVLVVFVSALTLPHAGTMHKLLLRYRAK